MVFGIFIAMKRFLKRYWPLLGIILLLIVALFYLFSSYKEILEKPALMNVFSEEGFKLEDVHYSQDNPDKGIKWTLDAREAKISKDRQFISFRQFRLKLETKDRPSIEIEGENGEFNKSSGELNLRDNVKGRTENGYRFMTDHVLYQQKEGFLKTESPVSIIGPSFSLKGRGLYLDIKREYLSLQADVHAVIENEAMVL